MQGRALFKTDAFVGCKRDLPPPLLCKGKVGCNLSFAKEIYILYITFATNKQRHLF